MPPADQVHGAVQDSPHDRQHFNVANHRSADYCELHDVIYTYTDCHPLHATNHLVTSTLRSHTYIPT